MAENSEEYVIGEKYYKDFPGSGYKQAKVDSIAEYDGWGNKIYEKKSDGRENWYKYDEQGNLIYEKNGNKYGSYEYESWYEYDERENIIHSIFTPNEIEYYGEEYWYEYTYWPDGTRKKTNTVCKKI